MEKSPVTHGESQTSLPLQCILEENETCNMQWQDFGDKMTSVPNSKLLFLTVEYVQDVGTEIEFNNISQNISDNGRISPFDPGLASAERFSPIYNNLVIPADGQSQFQNSVVILPASRSDSQPISILVDQSQVSGELIVDKGPYQCEKIPGNVKINSEGSQITVSTDTNLVAQINCTQETTELGRKLILTNGSDIVMPQDSTVDSLTTNTHLLSSAASFFQGEENKIVGSNEFASSCNESLQTEFSIPSSCATVLLNESDRKKNKSILDSSKYVVNSNNLKPNGILLSDSNQHDLLIKSETIMDTDSYNLSQETYISPEDGNSYPVVEEQLNINNIEKSGNEYLLPDAMAFEDAESDILQSNLEVFSSQVLGNNELLSYDRSRLRQRKHPAEHLGFEYWCEDCEFGVKCGRHEVKIVSDKPVLSRARATLPKELLAINKLHNGTNEEGVFARKTIMRRVQFGPVEGRMLKEWKNPPENEENIVKLLLETETGHFLKIDVSDEHESNWMRFVRKAKTSKEQNLILTQQGKSLYFITTRLIPPRQELKVGYSLQYAEKRKLKVLEDHSWACFECTSRFPSSAELQKHLNCHDNLKNSNENSGKKKSKNLGLKGMQNIMKFKGNNRIKNDKVLYGKENECYCCHKTFPRMYSLKRHLLLVHSDKDKENSGIVKNVKEKTENIAVTNTLFKKKSSTGAVNEWLCTHCNLTFDNPSVLNLHTLTHAAEDLESEAVLGLPSELSTVYHDGEFLVENGDIQCPQCTKEFHSKRELIEHVSTHGKVTLNKSSNISKPYKCDQCYKSFATDIRLQKHMLVHGSEESKPYQCVTCSKRFLNNSALSCHLKTHNEKKSFECSLCKKDFEQVFGLKEHVKIHSSNGFFTCPHCNKVFEGYSVVRKHIRAFHSGHQHICKDCGKSCPTLDKLRMHSLKHSDHREFLCANCGKQFKRKDKLKEHMKRMHSVEREMKIMSLALRIPRAKDKRFSTKCSTLAYDRFIYKCRTCEVGFKRRGMLVNHLAKRHPDIIPDTVPELNLPILKTTRDYFCQYCDKIYKSSSKRKAHILKNHPGAELPMSNRQKGGIPFIPGMPNPTFSKTVGSVKTIPHGCKWCHKQYASKAKLLQHQRKKHMALLPQSQQVPRVSKAPSSPVGGRVNEALGILDANDKLKQVLDIENIPENNCPKMNNGNNAHIVQEVFNVNGEVLTPDLNGTFKKTIKVLPENISNELLQQAMTELSESLSDYKIPFSEGQEGFINGIKEGGEEKMGGAQMTRTWANLSPYPPR